jgi:hypothetical protein
LFQSNPEFKELLLQTGNATLTLESDLADDIKSLITSTINTLRAHYRTMPVIPQTKLYTPSLVKQNEDTYTVAEISGLSFTRVDDKSFTISMVGIGSKVVNNEMFSEIKKMFNFGTSETPRYSKEVIALVIANRLGVNKDLVMNSLTLNFKTPQVTPTTTIQRKTYSGKVTSLQPNQIFVFGSNPLGINGNPSKGTGGGALVAYNIAGVKQGEKMDNKLSDSEKAWGITTVTAPGKKRSKTPQEITEGIKKLYEYAKQNPTKEFLVSDYSGTNLNGYTGQEMADMFINAGAIPSNIVFNNNFDKLIRSTTQQPTTIKPGVQELFDSNSELANIGTAEQYSAYLDTIFPDSQVKDIVYHGTPDGNFDSFDINQTGKNTKQFTKGIYFTDSKKTADFYAEGSIDFSQFESLEEYNAVKTAKVFSAVLNAKNLKLVDSPQAQDKQGDAILRTKEKLADNGLVGDQDFAHQYIVFDPEQIHILGNKQDVEGFKEFVSKKDEDDNNTPPSCGLSNF